MSRSPPCVPDSGVGLAPVVAVSSAFVRGLGIRTLLRRFTRAREEMIICMVAFFVFELLVFGGYYFFRVLPKETARRGRTPQTSSSADAGHIRGSTTRSGRTAIVDPTPLRASRHACHAAHASSPPQHSRRV